MTSIEWLREELWQQFKWQFSDNIFEVAKEMHKQEMETLYTEKQVREAIEMARFYFVKKEYTNDEIIQSLKQPKKD